MHTLNHEKTNAKNPESFDSGSVQLVAERTGLEPATPCVTGRYSHQLNYRSTGSFTRISNRLTPACSCYLSLSGEKEHVLYYKFDAWQFPTLAWGDPTLPSALRRFTSEFGMGSGGTAALVPPGKFVSSIPLNSVISHTVSPYEPISELR